MASKTGTKVHIQPLSVQASAAGESSTTAAAAVATIPGQPAEQFEVSEEASTLEDTIVYPTGATKWITIASLALTVLFVGLDMTIVAVTIPSLTNEFKTVNDIGWYSSAFMLVNASFTFLFSKAYTVFDVKCLYLVGIALFELGSLLCTVAPNSGTFILGRAVAGLGGSGLFTGAMTVLTYTFPLVKRPLWNGIFAAVQTVAMVAAPLIGGVLVDAFTWRACFGINLPVVAIAFGIIVYYFKNPVANPDTNLPLQAKLRKMDLLGSALFVPGIVCLLIGLQWGGTRYGWSEARIVVLLVLFVILVASFSYLQFRQQENATLPPRILRQRTVIAGAFFSSFCSGILAVTEYYIAIYFQGVRGYTATRSGVLGLPMIIGLSIGGLSSGVLTSMLGYYHPFMLATSILAPIATGLLSTLDLDENLTRVLALLGFLGIVVGLGIQGPTSAIQAVLAPKDIPIGIAINIFAGGIGTAIFLAAAAALFQNRLDAELARAHMRGFNTTSTGGGLADVRMSIGGDRLKEVLLGYDTAVTQTFYIPVACATLSILASLCIEWKSVKQKKA